MNNSFTTSFQKFKEKISSWSILFFWYRHYRKIFFIGFLIVFSLGGWDYYYSVFRYRLTDEEKNQYINSYFKEVLFDKKKFLDTIDTLEKREESHTQSPYLTKNIFQSK